MAHEAQLGCSADMDEKKQIDKLDNACEIHNNSQATCGILPVNNREKNRSTAKNALNGNDIDPHDPEGASSTNNTSFLKESFQQLRVKECQQINSEMTHETAMSFSEDVNGGKLNKRHLSFETCFTSLELQERGDKPSLVAADKRYIGKEDVNPSSELSEYDDFTCGGDDLHGIEIAKNGQRREECNTCCRKRRKSSDSPLYSSDPNEGNAESLVLIVEDKSFEDASRLDPASDPLDQKKRSKMDTSLPIVQNSREDAPLNHSAETLASHCIENVLKREVVAADGTSSELEDKKCEDTTSFCKEDKPFGDASGVGPPSEALGCNRESKMEDAVPSSKKWDTLRENVTEAINKESHSPQLLQSSPQKVLTGCFKRKLLVLDVNGLLADIVSDEPHGYVADTIIGRKYVFKRAFCDDFLRFCFERFNVGVWSSRTRRNVQSVLDFLMEKTRHKLLFCWDQSHCTETGFNTVENRDKPLLLKELKRLWEKREPDLPWERGDYNESNTLLLDDSPYKALRNPPYTAIFPRTYHYWEQNDNSLGSRGDLRLYLEGLASAESVQKYVQQNPFGQRPITKTNPSWRFYLRIISTTPSQLELEDVSKKSPATSLQLGDVAKVSSAVSLRLEDASKSSLVTSLQSEEDKNSLAVSSQLGNAAINSSALQQEDITRNSSATTSQLR